MTSLIASGLVLLLCATSMAEVRDDRVGNEGQNSAAEAVSNAARNLEQYRAEVDALVRGAPSFANRQRRLTGPHSLPGNPLAGMELPASRPGEVLPGRNTSTLMVFLTLSMPDEALAGWLEQTARAGGVAVIRGFHGDRLSATLKRLTALQEMAPATKERGGVSIDPTAFARFAVDVAPTVIVSAAPLPPCATRGCADDPAPAHDRIAGNVTLRHALGLLATDGDQATGVARHHLTRLEAPTPEGNGPEGDGPEDDGGEP